MPAATSWTPPTDTPEAPASPWSASSSATAATATGWCWRRSSPSPPSPETRTPAATDGRTSTARWRARCEGSRPTTSTSTGFTPGTGSPRSTRSCRRSTGSCAPARCGRSAFSDVPAWYLARAQTIAEFRGWEPLCALQLEYSLVERNIEREHVPAALALGVGICPWSPLASGMLSGKYRRDQALEGQGRLGEIQKSGNPGFLKLFTDRNWQIVDVLVSVAREMGRPPAQVALNWVARRPGVTSTILGATKPAQLDDNLAALSFELPEPLRKKLDEVTRPETVHPYHFFEPGMQMMMTGGTRVSSR